MSNVFCMHLKMSEEYPNGCEIYRGNMPMAYLAKHHPWKASWGYYDEILAKTLTMGSTVWDRILAFYDLFVLPRATGDELVAGAVEEMIDTLHKAGRKVVYEVDDDFTGFHRSAPPNALRIASKCDAITVTTPFLAELMHSHTNRPTYVLPNMITPEDWKKPIPHRLMNVPSDSIIIGLTGSPTHQNDWKVLETVLPAILDDHPEVHLVLGGFAPEYFDDLPQTVVVPGLPYSHYADLVKGFDIVLAPVDPHDPFNNYKSPIKAIEGMAAEHRTNGVSHGAAVIATNNQVYRLAIDSGYNGLLVDHTPEAWYAALVDLIENREKRMTLARNGYRWAWKHHNMAEKWPLWATAYRTILKS